MSWFGNIYRSDAKVGRFMGVLALWGVAYGLYRGIQDNYLAEIIHISPFERGIVEFFREMPGLLVVVILAMMYRFTASKIFKIGTAITVGGMAGLLLSSTSPLFMTKVFVIVFMVVFSTGEHILMPVRSTIAMDLAKRDKAGASLGIAGAISHFGNIFGFIIVIILFIVLDRYGIPRTDVLGYRMIFSISFALLIASTLVVLALQETTL
ncbi:MAG: PucC family protein, partial [Treponema sp.]|nr:PucC family protein [Treponema sp.]